MTGLYPYRVGRQGWLVLTPKQPTGLTLDRTLLPGYLQSAGYDTHMVGKWHLGYCKEEFTTTRR